MAGKGYLGIDVGSVSTNLVIINDQLEVLHKLYLRTRGQPIRAVQEGLIELKQRFSGIDILGVGTTGSGRVLAGVLVGADVVKNEITAHAVAATSIEPEVRTVIEIGGQDSKIIILRQGVVVDFAMNTVCAAGTGSFLDQQAGRLGVPIEEFGELAVVSKKPVRIAGRCTVFAESDMIHKQQMGHSLPDIIAGLCEAMVRNYLNNVGKGKEILEPILFQGGVAANIGMKNAFEEALSARVIVPQHFNVMGAIGAALLARENNLRLGNPSSFRGFEVGSADYRASSFECTDCPNRCEIVNIILDGTVVARWGSRCGKWDEAEPKTGAAPNRTQVG